MGGTFDPIKKEWEKAVGVSKKELKAERETGIKHSELQQANKSIARMLLVRQGDIKVSIFDEAKHNEFAGNMMHGVDPAYKADMQKLCDQVGIASQQITKSEHGPVHPERRLAAFNSVMGDLRSKLEDQQKEQLNSALAVNMSADTIERIKDTHIKQIEEFNKYFTEQRKLLCFAMLASNPGRQAIAVEKIAKMVLGTERARLEGDTTKTTDKNAQVQTGASKHLDADAIGKITGFFDKETRTSYKVNTQGHLEFNVAGMTDPKKLDRVVDNVLSYAHAKGWETLDVIETKNPAFAKKLYLAACAQGLVDDKHAGLGMFKPPMDMAALQKPGGDPYGFLKVIEHGEELRAKAKQIAQDPAAQKQALGEKGDLSKHAKGGELRDEYYKHQKSNGDFAKSYKEAVENLQKPKPGAENVRENEERNTLSPGMRS